MTCRSPLLTSFVILGLGVGILAFIAWPRTPRLVLDLKALPEAGKVEFVGNPNAPLTVVHLRDWHYACEALRPPAWDEECDHKLDQVQADHLTLLRFLIQFQEVTTVHEARRSKCSTQEVRLGIAILRDHRKRDAMARPALVDAEVVRGLRRRVGAAGQLCVSNEIENVFFLPHDFGRVDGAVPEENRENIPEDIDDRRRDMVSNLPTKGLAVIVLSGSHNLGPYLPPGTLYIQVTPRSYPGEVFPPR